MDRATKFDVSYMYPFCRKFALFCLQMRGSVKILNFLINVENHLTNLMSMTEITLPPNKLKSPKIAILMATYNGGSFIEEQLSSIVRQFGVRPTLVISDDGSADQTLAELKRFKTNNPKIPVCILSGPKKGFAENFRFLIQSAPDECDYYAFCDQDDIWMDSKMHHSIAAIVDIPKEIPTLYCGRTQLMSVDGKFIGISPAFRRSPKFANALVQSIAGGNTMVLNSAGLTVLKKASRTDSFVSHDWFAYQIISASGGIVVFDDCPQIYYRQHDKNVIGKNTGTAASVKRLFAALCGSYRRWNDINITLLDANRSLLCGDAIEQLDNFQQARTGNVFVRLNALRRSGVYRQTLAGTISLWVACILHKL